MRAGLLFVLIISVYLFGCVTIQTGNDQGIGEIDAKADASIAQVELRQAQSDYNAASAALVSARESISQCEKGKAECENKTCPACEVTECPVQECNENALQAKLDKCSADKEKANDSLTTCNTSLTQCVSGKSACNDSLNSCNADKAACQASLTAAQNAVPATLVWHYGPGNFYTSADNVYREIEYKIPAQIDKAMIGLVYSGGSDPFFGPGVIPGMVRWYTLTSNDGKVFNSDIDGTVYLDLNNPYPLRIKRAEFTAGTSKEGLAIQKVIAIYIYDEA
ncbi:MAG: hypothetical protein AABW99_01260 [archaeon]